MYEIELLKKLKKLLKDELLKIQPEGVNIKNVENAFDAIISAIESESIKIDKGWDEIRRQI